MKSLKNLIIVFVFFFVAAVAYAEGSKDFYPSGAQGNRAYLVCTDDPGSNGNSWPYLTMGVHYVYAKEGEVIAAAFSARSGSSSNCQGGGTNCVRFRGGRIRMTAPNGSVYITDLGTVYTVANAGGQSLGGHSRGGLILNRAEELAGPHNGASGAANRYIPFTRTVASNQVGVWKVEFLPNGDTELDSDSDSAGIGNLKANASWDQDDQPEWDEAGRAFVAAWDVSVRTGTTWIPGRVYTNVTNLLLPSEWAADESFYGTNYVLTKDGVAYRVKFQGVQGAGWTFFTNNKGFIGLDGEASYKSKNFTNFSLLSPYLHDPRSADNVVDNYVTHKMFYVAPATGANGLPNTLGAEVAIAGGGTTWLKNPRVLPEMEELTFTGVEGTEGQSGSKGGYIRFDSNVKGLYKITIPAAVPRVLTGPCDIGPNEVFWDGTDGNGNMLPAGTTIPSITTQLYGAEVHFPYIDMEINPLGIAIELLDDNYTIITNMNRVYWDDTDITGGEAPRKSNPAYNGNTGTGLPSAGPGANGHKWGAHITGEIELPTDAWDGPIDNDGTGNGDFGNTRSIDTWSYAPGAEASADIEIVVMATDLRVDSLAKILGPNIVSVGNNLTYAAAIFNNGPSDATTAATSPATFFFYVPPGVTIDPNAVSFHSSVNGATPVGTKTFDPVTGIFKVSVEMPNQSGGTFQIPVSITSGVPDDTVNVWATIMRPEDISDPDATNPDINIPLPTDAFQEANGIHAHSNTLPIYTNPSAINLASTNNIKGHSIVQMYTNMSITKSVSPAGPHTIGQQVVFTINVANAGVSNASQVKVTDLLTPRYTYVSHNVSTGTYNQGSGIWNIGTMNNGGSATMTITATINANGGTQINTAAVTMSEYDPNTANNTASATTNAPSEADLEISKTGFRTGGSGDETTFTITVTNHGPSDATNVVVTDNLSTRYNFSGQEHIVSMGSINATGTQSRNITWTIPHLANGAVATMVFIAVNNSSGVYDNTASVDGTEDDPVNSNNSDTVIPSSTGTAVNLGITKIVSTNTPNVGQNVTFTITAQRAVGSGTAQVNNVVVTDILPSGY
ncbi:MAG TPA: DUF11 domain-containing protein, partial [Flavobacterium sp.]|nr:DUF11 domain-containing protein [Flavobacterium sp.]